jgi:putative colanic acid biosynthesis acetyltransferase WcaF
MPNEQLDIASNRTARKYPWRELVLRVLWMVIGKPLFWISPRPLFAWRRFWLRCFGASIGKGVNIYPSATIYFPWKLMVGDWSAIGESAMIYNLGPITIGEQVTISQRAHLCAGTHDHTDPAMPLLKPPITVHDQAWICADAFVGPNITVGEGAIVGARAVAVKDVDPWTIVGGNPARSIGTRTLRDVRDEPPRS